MDALEQTVFDTIREEMLLRPGDLALVGFSGGPDSVCLLSVLIAMRGKLGIRVAAVHVNHGIRGGEAARDEAFARGFCRERGIPFKAYSVDVPALAGKEGLSEEEAGRKARYEIFREEAERLSKGENPPDRIRIAVAHHACDSAETILLNLFRGTGLKGLSGIPAKRPAGLLPPSGGGERELWIIRPLIRADREEIRAYLTRHGLPSVEDSTNRDTEYTRNYIRQVLLPGAASHVNAQAVRHVAEAGKRIREADQCLRHLAEKFCDEHTETGKDEGRLLADADALGGEEVPIREYAVREMLFRAGCPEKDITAEHIAAILDIAAGHAGRAADLPHGFRAVRTYGKLVLERSRGKEEDPAEKLRFQVFPCRNFREYPTGRYTKWFDYDRIKCKICVRYRQPGDYLMTGAGKKTLHRFMIDEHIPRDKRDRIPLVADGSHILWVVGYRVSESYKVSADTRRVLQVTCEGGKESV
jgi:tRNA(Ile)-lysidine synthase